MCNNYKYVLKGPSAQHIIMLLHVAMLQRWSSAEANVDITDILT